MENDGRIVERHKETLNQATYINIYGTSPARKKEKMDVLGESECSPTRLP